MHKNILLTIHECLLIVCDVAKHEPNSPPQEADAAAVYEALNLLLTQLDESQLGHVVLN